ncbi:MAG: DUF5694 domain-containing protein [Planctomycetota bacterium]
MLLGCFHFDSKSNVINPELSDIRSERFQSELEEITEALATWKPTKIMIEKTPDLQAEIEERYSAYRAGEGELRQDEAEQIGFRLAARLDLPAPRAVDYRNMFDFPGLMTAIESANQEELGSFIAAELDEQARQAGNPAEAERSITARLIERNDPARIAAEHAIYLDLAEAGSDAEPKGAEVVGAWWTRNVHIYANIARAAEAGDRILLIYGSGHAHTLRSCFSDSSRFSLVEPNPYLELVPAGTK